MLQLKKKAPAKGKALKPKVKSKATEQDTKPVKKFLLRGKAAKQEIVQEQEKQAQRDKLRDIGKNTEFFLKTGEEKRITFLDGKLDSDGDVTDTCFHQHSVYSQKLGYPKFACIADPDTGVECPLCEQQEAESGGKDGIISTAFVSIYTVLDWSRFQTHDGKQHKGSIRMLVAKPKTAELLRKYGKKRGGLAGATFDVSRSTDKKSPRVGDSFDFIGKTTAAKLRTHFKELDIKVIDYEKVINYLSEDELRDLGFGAGSSHSNNAVDMDNDEEGEVDDLF